MSEAGVKTESVGTVVVAGAANLAIAVAKLVAGLISGSAAMLSEAAHPVADTTTEVLLYQPLRRGARPADTRHPFGYGKESYGRYPEIRYVFLDPTRSLPGTVGESRDTQAGPSAASGGEPDPN